MNDCKLYIRIGIQGNANYLGGMSMPERKYSSASQYRYGFNGKENDNEVKGEGNQIDFGSRIYDPRLSRFLSIDPMQKKYPMLSPYVYVGNNPIKFVDFDGRDFGVKIDNATHTIIITMNQYVPSVIAAKQAQSAADEMNNTSAIVKIDGVEYKASFQVNVMPPSIEFEKKAAADPIGNFFKGTTDTREMTENSDGSFSSVAGQTIKRRSSEMFNVKDMNGDVTNMGNNPELVAHEFLHQMGQDDEGKGDKFDKNGRMKYTATAENGYKMNPISKGDIHNILKFAQENGKPQSEIQSKDNNSANAVLIGDTKNTIKNSSTIKVTSVETKKINEK